MLTNTPTPAEDTLISGLNDPQCQAVTAAPTENILVLAGAGSGKTRVLVHRIAWLIQQGHCAPHQILAVTFTNKAAREMRNRIEQLIDIPLQSLWVGTFHGLAHRLLRQHYEAAELPQHFQILDSDDQLRTLKRLCKSMNLSEEQWPAKKFQSFINHCKEQGKRSTAVDNLDDPHTRTYVMVYAAYEQHCQTCGVVDFAELLLHSYEMLQRHTELLQHYHQRFRHLLIDEFQDTNTLQYRWLKQLTHLEARVMAVGDDDQSIYSWRGANINHILNFDRETPNTRVVKLEQNYRSTGTILAAANAIIAHNPNRLGKSLWTEAGAGEAIGLYVAHDEVDEARFLASSIQRWTEHHGKRQDIAILYRSNAQSRIIEEALNRANIPYHIVGGLRFFERAEIKDCLGYLRLIANRDDDSAFERIINTPTRGIGATTVAKLRDYARHQACTLWQATTQMCTSTDMLSPAARRALTEFRTLIETLAHNSTTSPLHVLARQTLEQSGLLAHYQKDRTEQGLGRVENLEELVAALAAYTPDPEQAEPPLVAFLADIALDVDAEQKQQETASLDRVQMMTLHAAKGLEFPLVLLCGLEDGLFPHKMAMTEEARLDEERRLCYVGMTRAMRKLILSYAEVRRLYGQSQYQQPSRFLRDIPDNLVNPIRLRTLLTTQTQARTNHPARSSTQATAYHKQASPTCTPKTQGQAGDTGFRLGQTVRHAKFGLGTVLNYEGQSAHARVQIKFQSGDTKWLVVSYAKLEAV